MTVSCIMAVSVMIQKGRRDITVKIPSMHREAP
jgi:hypothetical protein